MVGSMRQIGSVSESRVLEAAIPSRADLDEPSFTTPPFSFFLNAENSCPLRPPQALRLGGWHLVGSLGKHKETGHRVVLVGFPMLLQADPMYLSAHIEKGSDAP